MWLPGSPHRRACVARCLFAASAVDDAITAKVMIRAIAFISFPLSFRVQCRARPVHSEVDSPPEIRAPKRDLLSRYLRKFSQNCGGSHWPERNWIFQSAHMNNCRHFGGGPFPHARAAPVMLPIQPCECLAAWGHHVLLDGNACEPLRCPLMEGYLASLTIKPGGR
jgi:hypothetical protein